MRNEHITPSTIVPKKLRLEIYKELYDKLKSGELSNESEYPYGLCRFLPKTLWGVELGAKAPNGDVWTIETAQEIFPELGKELKRLKIDGDYFTPQERLEFLEKVLKIKSE